MIYVRNKETIFAITKLNYHVPEETLSTDNRAEVLEQLKSGFKSTTNWNKVQSKVISYLIQTFREWKKLFFKHLQTLHIEHDA